MKVNKIKLTLLLCIVVCIIPMITLFSSCSDPRDQLFDSQSSQSSDDSEIVGDRDSTPVVYKPTADGVNVFNGMVSIVDISNVSKGYIMVKYVGTASKIKMQLRHENSEWYTYDLNTSGEFEVFPITTGDGSYTLTINENIEGTTYAQIDTATFTVELENSYTPFLHPNQYVNYDENSLIVAETQKIATGAVDDLDVVKRVYENVVENVEYDKAKAEVDTFYLPDVDETFNTKSGICFDYAALMTAMLRTQNIPTQLVIGYAGTAYHAWISVYTPETGWIDNMIEFNGTEWVRLDPTFASTSNNSPDMLEYVGDGQNYNAMYFY